MVVDNVLFPAPAKPYNKVQFGGLTDRRPNSRLMSPGGLESRPDIHYDGMRPPDQAAVANPASYAIRLSMTKVRAQSLTMSDILKNAQLIG
jgi:hypothetical protein